MDILFNRVSYPVDDPCFCPHCHRGIQPMLLSLNTEKEYSYSVWRCAYRDCGKLFVASFKFNTAGYFEFDRYLDGTPLEPTWTDSIRNLKSKFIKTYCQALEAESLGLDELSGMGFRKAIEYLVKDYLIQRDPSLQGKIEDLNLAKVIVENFTQPQEKDLCELLQRATWLGNDMTHYLQYHDNFDIKDLKQLTELVMAEIHSMQQKRFYISNILSKHPKKD